MTLIISTYHSSTYLKDKVIIKLLDNLTHKTY